MKQIMELDLKMARGLFELLGTNEYSLLWRMVDDFICNGHLVSIKESTQFYHVIIDWHYVKIGGVGVVQDRFGVVRSNFDYAMHLLESDGGKYRIGLKVELLRTDDPMMARVGDIGKVVMLNADGTVDIDWGCGEIGSGYDVQDFRVVNEEV